MGSQRSLRGHARQFQPLTRETPPRVFPATAETAETVTLETVGSVRTHAYFGGEFGDGPHSGAWHCEVSGSGALTTNEKYGATPSPFYTNWRGPFRHPSPDNLVGSIIAALIRRDDGIGPDAPTLTHPDCTFSLVASPSASGVSSDRGLLAVWKMNESAAGAASNPPEPLTFDVGGATHYIIYNWCEIYAYHLPGGLVNAMPNPSPLVVDNVTAGSTTGPVTSVPITSTNLSNLRMAIVASLNTSATTVAYPSGGVWDQNPSAHSNAQTFGGNPAFGGETGWRMGAGLFVDRTTVGPPNFPEYYPDGIDNEPTIGHTNGLQVTSGLWVGLDIGTWTGVAV